MAFRAKTYPYPLLASYTDDYLNKYDFESIVKIEEFSDTALTIVAHWDDSRLPPSLADRLLNQQAVVALNVECAATYRRWILELPASRSCEVNLSDILGDIEITVLILNRENGTYLPQLNDEISEDFAGAEAFHVMKGDPLAISDAWQFNLTFEGRRSNDLLRLQFVSERKDDSYVIRLDEDQIVVIAGEHLKKALSTMWKDPILKPSFAMSVAKDAIVAGLIDLTSKAEVGDGLEFQWQKSLYARAQELGFDPSTALSFQEANTLAQLIVGKSGIQKMVKNAN